MLNSNDGAVLTTASGFKVLIWYEMSSGNVWIKDISAEEWYFNAFNNGWHFELLIEGEPCHQIRRGEDVKDKNLLRRLCEAKRQYVEN